ncbi:XdhC/CoxI family protein [Kordiimonas sediminis]|uniref:XdhC/CoxI family protein n=1 Tax=Kordiimonas sediminis TaxID=1735581 RepID=A0A919E8T4_9PROT|nr:XdhC family protein [Kordiimonas sediminis]GHF25302.1 XdhC/CoxI family protein [Kordiimonas sediminis]
MIHEIETLLKWHGEGHKTILAIVLSTWGSAPRQAGSMMVIRRDQAFEGSVSGGCVEGEVIAEAMTMLHFGGAKKLSYGISNENAWAVGLSCGGQIEILLITVEDSQAEHLETALKKIKNRKTEILEINTRTGEMSAPKILSTELRESPVPVMMDRLFFLPFRPADELVIVGAVHIAQALAPMAKDLGFDVTVVDPREAFAQEERFPGINLVTEWPDVYLRANTPSATTAVVLLTHSPKLDDAGLMVALKSPAFYIGALGSKNSHAERLERLRETGAEEESLQKIKGPIGLDIKAKTPKEIAVSILAEIIAEKRAT